ncbi:MAG: KamA family radical SAM protein [Candidatus Gastranaerophilaceae bacterium]
MKLNLLSNKSLKKDLAEKNKTQIFRETYYPHTVSPQWNDWKWQLAHRITTKEELMKVFNLSERELSAFSTERKCFPLSITPYYASLIDNDDVNHPIRRAVIPVVDEHLVSAVEMQDPLSEASFSPVPGIVHRYPDRVLFLTTNFCSVYCRYCTRSRMVGNHEHYNTHEQWEKAIEYIKSNKNVRDVLLSGGDPLTMETDQLEWLLSRLSKIEHVEFIRIGTKVPVVLPQRINSELVNMLKKYHPLWVSIHFTHPDELTEETRKACAMLADVGIPLGSQTVLLKGINDNVKTMTKLCHELLKARVKPYYLYQCDLVQGSTHFRTSVQAGIDIIDGMRGYTTGYAVPNYVIDAPNGGGKIRILPESIVGKSGGKLLLKNYQGEIYTYPDAAEE